MRVLLLHLDGKYPNLALMRLAAYHRTQGDEVVLRRGKDIAPELAEGIFDRVYGSLLFSRTREYALHLRTQYPEICLGGTGWDVESTLEEVVGVQTCTPDYTDYPDWTASLGFTQRGCRLRCPFCVVPRKEGSVREEHTIREIWRGEPWPRAVVLLDNDFFGQPHWQQRIQELHDGHFLVNFSQGINARLLTDETAAALASVQYRDTSMRVKRLYTAWDNRNDEKRLFAGLERLVKYGVKPDHIMVYMLIGYWPGETDMDREYRRRTLRAFGCRPYPMPYVRTAELVGFQRFVIGAYDKKILWDDWKRARYDPRQLGDPSQLILSFAKEEGETR